jgi:hypothetical protein
VLLFELEGAMWRLVSCGTGSWEWRQRDLWHGDWTVGKCLAGEVPMGEGRCPLLRMGISAVSFRREVSCAERAQRM